jgi:solute:Na+ symporter, SSS family
MEKVLELLKPTSFSAFDWVLVIVYPTISLFIGLFVRKFIKNMDDFVCAGRGLGTALGIATMTGTELGLITVMYSAQKGFKGGFAAFHIALVAGVVTFVVGCTGFIVFRLREMKVMTIPEFYERRFDRKTRILGGIMMALGGILNMGLFLKIGSMFIVGITGLSAESWALPAVMIFLIGLVLIYTCLGGMISVVIADYVQFVVLSFGMLVAVLLCVKNVGWSPLFETIARIKGNAGFDPTVAEGGFGLEYILFVGFIGLVSCAIWPTAVARALAMKSPQAVKRQYMWSSVSFLIRFLIPYFWGICAFVYFTNHSPEVAALFSEEAIAANPDRSLYAMPLFLSQILPAGFIGLISAAMLAAFMSTHDSYLLCWSSVLTEDVINPLLGERLAPRTRITIARVLIVVIGLYVLGWGLLYKGSLDIFDYMGITGAIYFAGAFALLLCGLYWKRASSTGAFMALWGGLVAILGLGPITGRVNALLPECCELSAPRITLISIGLTTLIMIVGSLLFPDKDKPLPAETATA